jgi:uncharacterized alkaline shock family protein YloU
MAEQKEYLDIQEEDGVIRVSFISIGEIAAQSALAVPGVSCLATVSQAVVKGVAVSLSEIGICSVDVHILVTAGHVISQVAKAVQSAVKTAVDAAIGIEVAAVNVFVAGMATR